MEAEWWEVRGYLVDYGPYASMSFCSSMRSQSEATRYFAATIGDTGAALVLLVACRKDGWERVVDRWRPDARDLAAELHSPSPS